MIRIKTKINTNNANKKAKKVLKYYCHLYIRYI